MNSRQAIKLAIDAGDMVSMAYLEDLTDQEMLRRPCPGCNHVNWQVGHLIAAENGMLTKVAPNTIPPLPAGFADNTDDAILSGCLAAQAGAIERAVRMHGASACLLSGGAAPRIAPALALAVPLHLVDNIVMIGLQAAARAGSAGTQGNHVC